MLKIIGIICVAFAIASVLKVSLKQKKLNSSTICKCQGVVVENIPATPAINGIATFYPIYEYTYENETKRFQGKMPMTMPLPIGEKLAIYVDPTTGKTIDRATILIETVFALLFGALGFVFLVLGR